jgi:arginase family enzyme
MADIELIGVPRDAFDHHHVVDDGGLDLPHPDPKRGATRGLINEPALMAMTDVLNTRVGWAVSAGRFPFVYGGDCSTLLGIVTGLRDHVGALRRRQHRDLRPGPGPRRQRRRTDRGVRTKRVGPHDDQSLAQEPR